ncbi:MAG TPA: nucleoside deaminase [Candidatus Hydrothermia bacterium]|nr:nucleoside deaminase [Candidatus Hydrothermia bacterium]
MYFNERYFFEEALKEAEQAFREGEVPVGCVIAHEDKIIARGHNQTEALRDPTAHAEIIAIGSAANYLNNWRLSGCTLYVTLEPCLMCVGAMIFSRIDGFYYLLEDQKFGSVESQLKIDDLLKFNHKLSASKFDEPELKERARLLIKTFFKSLRE